MGGYIHRVLLGLDLLKLLVQSGVLVVELLQDGILLLLFQLLQPAIVGIDVLLRSLNISEVLLLPVQGVDLLQRPLLIDDLHFSALNVLLELRNSRLEVGKSTVAYSILLRVQLLDAGIDTVLERRDMLLGLLAGSLLFRNQGTDLGKFVLELLLPGVLVGVAGFRQVELLPDLVLFLSSAMLDGSCRVM